MSLTQKDLNNIQKIIIKNKLFSEYSIKNERYKLKSFAKKDLNYLFKTLINISLKIKGDVNINITEINDFTKGFILENKIYSNDKIINFHPEGLEFYANKFLSEFNDKINNEKGMKI